MEGEIWGEVRLKRAASDACNEERLVNICQARISHPGSEKKVITSASRISGTEISGIRSAGDLSKTIIKR